MRTRRLRKRRLALLLGGLIAVLALCCLGVVALAPNARRILQTPFWNTDPQFAARAARALLDYELPPNYQELKALTVSGNTAAVVIAHRERPDDIIFIQEVPFEAQGDAALTQTVEERWSREAGEHAYDTQPAGTLPAVIRGRPAAVRLLEGTDEKGRRIRQAAIVLAGKGHNLLLSIVMGEDAWDPAMVQSFLQSIK